MIDKLLERKSDSLIALLMPLLLVFMILSHSMYYLYAILALCIVKITKPEVLFPVYFISSLSTAFFAISEGLSAGRFISLLMIISLIINNFRIKRPVIRNNYDHHLLLFILFCFFSSLFSITGSFVTFFMIVQGLLVLFLLPKQIELDSKYMISVLYFGVGISLVGVWLQFTAQGFEQLLLSRYQGEDGQTNSNRIAMMVMQMSAVCVTPFIVNDNRLIKWCSLVLFSMGLVVIVLTGSRASLIASLLSFLAVFYVVSRKKLSRYIFPILIVIVGGILAFRQFSSIDSVVLDRFTVENLESDGGSERLPAIEVMLKEIFPHYPFFGVGLGGANFVTLARPFGIGHPCHNIIFDSLVQLGCVGFVIFISLVFKLLKSSWHALSSCNNSLYFVLPFILSIGAIVNGIGETIYVEKWFWNALALCCLFRNQNSI